MIYFKRYGFKGFIQHVYYYINTYIFYNSARLIRTPIEIRGKSKIDFGTNLTTGKYCRIESFIDKSNYKNNQKVIKFGENVTINDNVHIAAMFCITIGNNVLIASKVFISDHNHGIYNRYDPHSSPTVPPNERPISGSAVIIEDNVWLGEFTAILPGVTIGKGSIIGALSVVNKDIPPFCIAVGCPAKVIKKFNFETNLWESIRH